MNNRFFCNFSLNYRFHCLISSLYVKIAAISTFVQSPDPRPSICLARFRLFSTSVSMSFDSGTWSRCSTLLMLYYSAFCQPLFTSLHWLFFSGYYISMTVNGNNWEQTSQHIKPVTDYSRISTRQFMTRIIWNILTKVKKKKINKQISKKTRS